MCYFLFSLIMKLYLCSVQRQHNVTLHSFIVILRTVGGNVSHQQPRSISGSLRVRTEREREREAHCLLFCIFKSFDWDLIDAVGTHTSASGECFGVQMIRIL